MPAAPHDATTDTARGPLELLVLQPTPFCNLDCSYCYLPDRQSTRRMSRDTLEATFRWVFASGLAQQPFTLLWHAGEPLVLPVAYYEEAVELLNRHNEQQVPVLQSFQTNATLLTAEWCEYLCRHQVHIGVSVDGPEFLHDRHRRTRRGEGTLARVLRGIRLLHEHSIPFHVITVLTAGALDYPDELFDFYREHGIRSVGFNVEEIEGPHTASSLEGTGTPERFRHFFARFVELACAADPPLGAAVKPGFAGDRSRGATEAAMKPGIAGAVGLPTSPAGRQSDDPRGQMQVRELDVSAGVILRPNRCGPGTRTQENKPWAIVSVDCEGNFATYSPELLGQSSLRHGNFSLGNVATDPLDAVAGSAHFRRMEDEIARGVEMCREGCAYFPFCGGGAPVNKYFENGTFASTETLFCRLHKKVCVDVTLGFLERGARATGAALPAGPAS
jgi:uncharacterized protein